MTDHYCVFGNPIGHSKSPFIHAAFARQTGQDIEYRAILAPTDGFAASVRDFVTGAGKGANVTVPFKEEAYRLASRLTPRARMAGAVNTLVFGNDEIVGDNTDGCGLLRDLTLNIGCCIGGKRILLLGAGGAARGVIGPLLEENPLSLTIANRSPHKAEELVRLFAPAGPVAVSTFESLRGLHFDIVIDATSASLQTSLPPLPPGVFSPGSLAYTMMYGPATLPFRQFAEAQGAARVCDGLGMLVEQAAEAFFVWRGVRPDTRPVIDQLARQ